MSVIAEPLKESKMVHRFQVIAPFNPGGVVQQMGSIMTMHKDHPLAKVGIRFEQLQDLSDPSNTSLRMAQRAEALSRGKESVTVSGISILSNPEIEIPRDIQTPPPRSAAGTKPETIVPRRA